MSEKDAFIAWSTFVPFGPAHIKLLVEYFGSAKKAWEVAIREIREIGVSGEMVEKLEKHRKEFDLEKYLSRLRGLKVEIVIKDEEDYPARLREIEDPPHLLYVRKASPCETSVAEMAEVAVAVVGSRKASSYGRDVTERLVAGLVDAGVTIVSGLALGIDAVAHRTALEAGGKTIAVLGNGLDQIYPPSNRQLAEKLLEAGRGVLVSEYPLGYPALPQNFPFRNRIVSGISLAVLVIEGTTKSGTLLTAAAAARQGRDVFAVPGQITSPVSAAPNILIKNGAKLVQNVEDILEELNIKSKIQMANAKQVLPETEEEKKILAFLENEGLGIDNLVRISGLETGVVLATLTGMELKGMVKNVGGVYTKL